MRRNFADFIRSVPVMLKWLIISTWIGLLVGTVSSLFGHTLVFANQLREQYPIILYALPFGGLLIVFLYRFFKDTDDRGTNTIVASIKDSSRIPFRMAPLIFISTVITHLCGGSAGREGAAIQLGGSIAQRLGKVMNLAENSRRTIVMCGMSAGFSALFGTPMAAAIFSLEVVSVGIMHYSALVPCVTASMIAHFVARFFRVPPESFPVTSVPTITAESFYKIVVFAAVVGVASILFCVILHKAEYFYRKFIKNPYVRIFAAGCIIILLSAILRTDIYLGSGMGIIEEIFHGRHGGSAEQIQWYTFLLKMLFTGLTLGAGFKGGEIVPSFCIGAALGFAAASLMGLPVTLVAACGMVGLFCGVTNCPITSLLISFELFGFAGMPYYLITIAVSYLLSGYDSLYHEQKIVYSKTETSYEQQDMNSETHE